MSKIIAFMKDYNKLLERYEKAEIYFADESIPVDDKIAQSDNIKLLVSEMDKVSKQIITYGYIMKDYEYFDGFRQIKYLEA